MGYRTVKCPACRREHSVGETVDSNGNVVGLFCFEQKKVIAITSDYWNGIDMRKELRKFLVGNVNPYSLKKVSADKRDSLARKMAYLFRNTELGQLHRVNYEWLVCMTWQELGWLRYRGYRDIYRSDAAY